MDVRNPKLKSKSAVPVRPLPASVEVQIEELVLHGFGRGDSYRIGEAMERELSRILAEQGVPAVGAGWEAEHLDGGSLALTPRSKAEKVGEHIAHVVYAGLSKSCLEAPAQPGSWKEGRADA